MSKRFGRFTNQEVKTRIRKNKRVWLWKWTSAAYHKYKRIKQ